MAQEVQESKRDFRLDIFQVGDNSASNAYIRGKMKDCAEVGIKAVLHKFPESITDEELQHVAHCLRGRTDGMMLQLPIPKHISLDNFMKEVPPNCDVDGLHYFEHLPCTPKGIMDWLDFNRVSLEGKRVVIIGRSRIVGKPLATWMLERNATVTVCHSHTPKGQVEMFCKSADIIIVAVGQKGFLDFDCPKALIIDVGINYGEDGKLHGDVKEGIQAQYVTPVPGGVGLLTRLALLKNLVEKN